MNITINEINDLIQESIIRKLVREQINESKNSREQLNEIAPIFAAAAKALSPIIKNLAVNAASKAFNKTISGNNQGEENQSKQQSGGGLTDSLKTGKLVSPSANGPSSRIADKGSELLNAAIGGNDSIMDVQGVQDDFGQENLTMGYSQS